MAESDDELYLPDLVRWYRDSDASDRKFAMRHLIEVDPAVAVETLVPEYDARVRLDIVEGLRRHRVKEGIAKLLDPAKDQPRPAPVNLTAFLAEPDDDVRYRIDGLWPSDGRIILAAQNKSGKTTLVGNLARSLVDGDPFLDTFGVEPANRVVLIDNEMSPSHVRRWLRDQGIRKTDAVEIICLRGKVSSFDILDAATRVEWAELIGPADVLIFDVLRPALDALGLSEDKESGRFLTALDELCDAAGIPELVLVHHMGHTNERSRGDSRLEDWPDAKWRLVKQPDPDNPNDDGQNGPRFFSAYGRDVDQPEVRLGFDPDTRHLKVDGGSRRQTTRSKIENAVQLWVDDNPGCSQGDIERGVAGDNTTVREAIKALALDGWLRIEKQGPGRATLHYPSHPAEQDFQ